MPGRSSVPPQAAAPLQTSGLVHASPSSQAEPAAVGVQAAVDVAGAQAWQALFGSSCPGGIWAPLIRQPGVQTPPSQQMSPEQH
jgi:hypothetical protein